MSIYYSTFITGLQDVIQQYLKEYNIITILDGAVIYETNKTLEEINKHRFFQNTFLVLEYFKYNKNNININDIFETTNINNCQSLILEYLNTHKKIKTFKIFSSLENQFISVNRKLLGHFENKIEAITKLKVELNRKKPDLELWFLIRSEKIALFLLRLTNKKQDTQKGELKQELSNILCLLSNMKETDIILDPFCGSGSIMLERSRIQNFRGIFACDNNIDNISSLKNKIKKINNKKLNKSFFVKYLDFFNNTFDNEFFTTIITDPPWGIYTQIDNIEDFYYKMLLEMIRILKHKGIIIILSANKEIMNNCINKLNTKIHLLDTYNTLVSGKKAGIFKIEKI